MSRENEIELKFITPKIEKIKEFASTCKLL